MLNERDYLVRQEQYKELQAQAEHERLVSKAVRKANKEEHKPERKANRERAPQNAGGLVLQVRRLMSFLL